MSKTANWTKSLGAMILAAISVAGAGQTAPAQSFVSSAHHFVEYYQALEDSPFVERVTISLALSHSDAAPPPPRQCSL